MYIYMGHMRFEDTKPYQDHFWRTNRIDLVRGWVTSIDTDRKQLTLDGASARRPMRRSQGVWPLDGLCCCFKLLGAV